MADSGIVPQINSHLLSELRHRFPEVPVDVVTQLMKQNLNNRERCIDALGRESEKYLYGGDFQNPFNNLHLVIPGESKTHSNSTSQNSGVDEGNGLAVNQNPPKHFNHSHSSPHFSTQGQYVVGTPGAEPQTAPPMTLTFDPFRGHGPPTETLHQNYPSHNIVYSSGGGGKGSHEQLHTVSHTSPPQQTQQSIFYPAHQHSHFTGASSHGQTPLSHAVSSSSEPTSYNQQWYRQGIDVMVQSSPSRPEHFNSNFPQDRTGGGKGSPSSYLGSPQRSGGGGFGLVSNQTPPHQYTTLDLQAGMSLPVVHQTSAAMHGLNIGTSPQQPMTTHNSSGAVYPQHSSPSTSPNYKTQAYIQINPNMTSPSGHAMYYMSPPQPSQSPRSGGTTPTHGGYNLPYGVSIRPRTPEPNPNIKHNILNIKDPDLNRVRQQPIQPTLSPASSMGSLSGMGDSSTGVLIPDLPPVGRTSRSGSLVGTEDMAYMQALLLHQRARMEKLIRDLDQESLTVQSLRVSVSQKENDLRQRRKDQGSRFPTRTDVQKICDENRKLEVDTQLLTREIDMINNGETPLGILDPLEQQNFYRHITPGQSGSFSTPTPTNSTTVNTIYSRPDPHTTTPRRTCPRPPPPRDPGPPSRPPPPPPHVHAEPDEGEQWSCSACTFLNHPTLDKCEVCEMPRIAPGYR